MHGRPARLAFLAIEYLPLLANRRLHVPTVLIKNGIALLRPRRSPSRKPTTKAAAIKTAAVIIGSPRLSTPPLAMSHMTHPISVMLPYVGWLDSKNSREHSWPRLQSSE
jgi:hypothetical protein